MVIKRTKEEKMLITEIGKRVRAERIKANVQQRELAEKIGYKIPYSLHLLENGKVEHIDFIMLYRIFRELGVPIRLEIGEVGK